MVAEGMKAVEDMRAADTGSPLLQDPKYNSSIPEGFRDPACVLLSLFAAHSSFLRAG